MYDTNMTEEPYVSEEDKKTEEEEKTHSTKYLDLYEDAKRLDLIIRRQLTRYKKAYNKANDDLCVTISNNIGLLTTRKYDITCTILKVEDVVKGKTYYNPR